MQTGVESVFSTAKLEATQNGQPPSGDAGSELVAQETRSERSPEAPQEERLPEERLKKAPWSGWAWLGLHKTVQEKSFRPESPSYKPLTAKSSAMPSIVHVRLDAFFASVEQTLNPKLCGKPVLVGREVMTSASYEATMHGVKTGMTLREALRRCPKAVVVPGQYRRCADFAERVKRILETYTRAVETASSDDFYLDFAGTEQMGADLRGTLLRLKMETLKKTGLSVSIGAGRTKVVAAMASRLEQPRGLRIVPVGGEKEFLAPLPVEKLPGIGRANRNVLAERGVTMIGELRLVPKPTLERAFGAVAGRQIWEWSRGLDGREAGRRPMEAPVSREMTIESDTADLEFLDGPIEYLSERVGRSLRDCGKQAWTIGVRVRYVDGFSVNQTVRLARSSNDERELAATAKKLFEELFTRRAAVELVGTSAGNLEAERHQRERSDCDANQWWSFNHRVASVGQLERKTAHGLVMPTPCLSR